VDAGPSHRVVVPRREADLENLVLPCLFHHRLVHEYGWSIRREPNGEVTWIRPDGIRFHAEPGPPWVG